MFSEKYLEVISARFTVKSILSEMATGDRLRVTHICH